MRKMQLKQQKQSLQHWKDTASAEEVARAEAAITAAELILVEAKEKEAEAIEEASETTQMAANCN